MPLYSANSDGNWASGMMFQYYLFFPLKCFIFRAFYFTNAECVDWFNFIVS
jgi:hypothetical protein